MEYQEKAFEIIKNSIKSAVFIDEKAREFYSNEISENSYEEGLSVALYNKFKEEGISLSVHKFQNGDEKNQTTKDYLFENRNLILLDWNLDGDSGGQEFSLELLADIVKRSHIHFCVIYTSEDQDGLNSVFENILSYFSNNSLEYYSEIEEVLSHEDGIAAILPQLKIINLYRDSDESGKEIGKLFKTHKSLIEEITKITGVSDKKCALIRAEIALGNAIKSSLAHPYPTYTSFSSRVVVIENTIITILNKNENQPSTLIKNLANQLISYEKSNFMHLLGLEMQTIFSKSSSFIDSNHVPVSIEALLHHRENYKNEGIEHFFPEFIKEIMIEKAKLNLRSQSLALLEVQFLDDLKSESREPVTDELVRMNVFYNSSNLESDAKLNFGDVFRLKGEEEYVICITALCDCLRPEKINNTFFFAKGSPISKDVALKSGDTAFISYVLPNKVIKWAEVNSIWPDLHQYSPVYIKPVQFTDRKSVV